MGKGHKWAAALLLLSLTAAPSSAAGGSPIQIHVNGTAVKSLRLVSEPAGTQGIWSAAAKTVQINSGKQAPSEKAVKKPAIKKFGIRGVAIGDSEVSVVSKLGSPLRKDPSEYGFTWFIYHHNYRDYLQVGISNGKVKALYTNNADIRSTSGIKIGTKKSVAEKQLGTPVTSFLRNNVKYMLNDGKEIGRFPMGQQYVTLFYDKYNQYKVTSVLLIEKATEESFARFEKPSNVLLAEAYEKESLDLINALRIRLGKLPFIGDSKIAGTARKHSQDMINNEYFDHTNPKGQSPFDRMEKDGIVYSSAAENIAAGQQSAIFAHEAWMNSEGHRKNLISDYKRLGVGVSFGGKMNIYYTQNFYSPIKS
ncbi:CAP domain-containing protein [Paenibacillus gansuensis]|uniref:CAP domain-containing protein n=1 Tax=Paenibacillus gansuensis TaxID=306542 RepID=A0ABW5PBB6_9BACL